MTKVNESVADTPSELKPRGKKNLRRNSIHREAPVLSISVKTLVKICLECVTWEEAKPLVDLMEKVFGMNPPSTVKASIKRIKRKFSKKFHRQVIKTKKVVMKNNRLEAMNKITNNKHVSI